MEPEDLVRELAKRTQINLDLVTRAERQGSEAFPTTQLMNSLLALLVVPRQHLAIPKTRLSELIAAGWRLPRDSIGRRENLKQLVDYLRHAVCHGNIRFINEDREITGIIFWNKPSDNAPVDWQASLTMEDLQDFVRRFAEIIDKPASSARLGN
jgi:hypothetical protein